ncbi:hypothetical protein EJ02DRAFT_483681 [Clathrospora elynae]|uniref:Uncharacterized protein n=1 Tax=Clathrospora elynae TaxID=706981 RepID=A0A6A5S820_9PLEO|nr:hypothetical protein EJ02DRAFT_483681 [Clathrospora elynae]
MSSALKQDICGVGVPGALAAEVERTQLEQYFPPDVQYACLYWIQHLAKNGIQLSDNDEVHMFLKEHCLYWLEALGWMGKVSEGIHAISSLQPITRTSNCPGLYAFVYNMKRFAQYSRSLRNCLLEGCRKLLK